jgi:hypothetical protein
LGIEFTNFNCPKLDIWRQRLSSDHIEIIFAANYASNPASVMGHTFLKFAKDGREDYFNEAVGYAAAVDDDVGAFKYMRNGLFGGFSGIWPRNVYYEKVHEYTNMERRDIWEYTLKLNKEEREILVEHIWELAKSAELKYFFIDENCSYMILATIQVARPDIDLLSGFPIYVIPVETIKKLDSKNLILQEKYRPSIRNQMLQKYYGLSDEKKSAVLAAIKTRNIENLNDAIALETILDYITLQRQITSNRLDDATLAFEKSVMLARAKLGPQKTITPPTPPTPLGSHGTYLAKAGYGSSTNQGGYTLLGFRPSVHGYFDRDQGYQPNSALVLVDGEAKFFKDKIRLSKFTFIGMANMLPFTALSPALSWRFSTGYEENKLGTCSNCGTVNIHPEAGISFALSQKLDLNILGQLDWQALKYHDEPRLWPGIMAEGVWRISGKMKLVQQESYLIDVINHEKLSMLSSKTVLSIYEIGPHWSAGLENLWNYFFDSQPKYWEGSAKLLYDF